MLLAWRELRARASDAGVAPVVTLSELMAFLHETLGEAGEKDPYLPNGLQVPGRPEIRRLATGVSATIRFFQAARDWGADALLVHHGINGPARMEFDRLFLDRLRFLLESDLSLIAYHYLLDSHPELGHAAQILQRLGARPVEPCFDDWGWIGELAQAQAWQELDARLTEVLEQEGTRYWFGPPEVRRIAVATGSATPDHRSLDALRRSEVDLYITGEVSEWVREMAREAGLHFVGGGHYNTERFGLWALGAKIEERFPIEVEFIDIPNPV